MTEEEAKTKWCHVSIQNQTMHACEGSKCMAWRTIPMPPETVKQYEKPDDGRHWVMTKAPTYDTLPEWTCSSEPIPHGYCGLAGKP